MYQDSMNTLYETISKLGGTFVGFTSKDGHSFLKSKAIRNDKFVGLAIDEDNQSNLTKERLNTWIEDIRSSWALT